MARSGLAKAVIWSSRSCREDTGVGDRGQNIKIEFIAVNQKITVDLIEILKMCFRE